MSVIRDREETKRHILRAVGTILENSGFQDIGINNIAREAGVDKVLIYRYFGGLKELLHVFVEQGGLWPKTDDITTDDPGTLKDLPLPQASIVLLKGYLRELRNNPSAQEILREELVRRDGLASETAVAREKQGRDLVNILKLEPGLSENIDITAVASLLSAGFTYLLLRAKTTGVYLGMDLKSEEDWDRIEMTLEEIVRAIFNYAEQKQNKDKSG